ncbi:hypothetical protein NDU88_006795 [Pleurodeles waltl]|uniref:Uncharacterized protein n=1 Tax=Pleurodeles waltl TaxID=8319 RepID=A0AAV7N2E0_PLEWA|nr:hypothetical protein NDU88_006795 [Pleurodeles waltl]
MLSSVDSRRRVKPLEERLRRAGGRVKLLEERLRRTEGPVRDSLSDARWNKTRADRTESKLRDRTLGGARATTTVAGRRGGGKRGKEKRDKTAAKR